MQQASLSVATFESLVAQLRADIPIAKPFSRDTRFVADVGLCSLDMVGLVFLCEQTFQVDLTSEPELVPTLHTIGQVIDAIEAIRRSSAE